MFKKYENIGIDFGVDFYENNIFFKLTVDICVRLLLLLIVATEAISNLKLGIRNSQNERSQIV